MKKVLTIFSVFILGLGSSLAVTSCTSRVTHDIDDDRETNKDIETLNNIKKEVNQYLTAFWNKKVLTDINVYPGYLESFDKVVNTLETENKIILTGDKIPPDSFLQPLLKGFLAEFNVINDKIKNDYSNYYDNTVPLELAKNNIQFTLYYINYNTLAKLVAASSQTGVMGITIQFDISYDVQFNGQQQPDQIKGTLVVTNNVNAVSNMQDNLKNYFVTFVGELFKKENYQVILGLDSDFYNDISTTELIWNIIKEELNKKKIKFLNSIGYNMRSNPTFNQYSEFYKISDSVLKWAGEGYDSNKFTAEKFLEFYKEKRFFVREGNYYIRGTISGFYPNNFTIENLPFKNPTQLHKFEKSVSVLVPTEKVDQDVAEFAKVTMDFWNYYKIATYHDQHKVIFKIKQEQFDELVNNSKVIAQKKDSYNLTLIFKPIFELFERTFNLKIKFVSSITSYSALPCKVNFIRKLKSLTLEIFLRYNKDKKYRYHNLVFTYNSFAYSFFFLPKNNESNITDGKFTFLQKIAFEVT